MSFNKYIKSIISSVKMATGYRSDKNAENRKNIISEESNDASCKEPVIHILRRWEKSGEFFAPGGLLYVEHGKGLLHEEYFDDYSEKSCLTLMFGDVPLFQFQGSGYFCPTCEKIVKSGYNLEKTKEFSFDAINADGADFEDVLEQMKPLLGLLEEGFYCLWDTQLYPTDGNGNLFWDYPNEDRKLQGSCICRIGDFYYSGMAPHFTIATQPKRLFNEERAEYYRDKRGSRAIAYYMDGNLTALIDGHHKAVAAAMEHREVSAVVISRCTYSSGSNGAFLLVNDISFDLDDLGNDISRLRGVYDRLIDRKRKDLDYKEINYKDETTFPFDTKALAIQYPTVIEEGCIDYFDTIDDELIDRLVYGKSIDRNIVPRSISSSYQMELQFLICALGCLKHKRFFEVVDHVLHMEVDIDTLLVCVRQIGRQLDRGDTMGTGMDIDKIKDYLITYMAEIEEEIPTVGREIFMML